GREGRGGSDRGGAGVVPPGVWDHGWARGGGRAPDHDTRQSRRSGRTRRIQHLSLRTPRRTNLKVLAHSPCLPKENPRNIISPSLTAKVGSQDHEVGNQDHEVGSRITPNQRSFTHFRHRSGFMD
ncbi:hypothetical protein OTU49_005621, partial [Cherax quadricarinatus]